MQICPMLTKAIKILRAIFTNPAVLLRVLQPTESEARIRVQQKYKINEGLNCISIFDLIENQNASHVPLYTASGGGSMLTDYYLLLILANTFKCKTYFEIGTWRGESAANVAPFVEQVYSLNLDDTNLLNRGSSPEYVAQIGMLCKSLANVTLLKGDSTQFDLGPYYNQCDLIFIDGDHNYTTLVQDTQNALKLRRNPNSIIVWHDYAHEPNHIRHEVLLAILDAVPEDLHSFLYHVSNTKCAVLLNKHYDSKPFNSIAEPQNAFHVTLRPISLDGK